LNISKWIDESAEKFGDKPAIYSNYTSINYSQLKLETDKFASACKAAGIKKGDRVGICMINCIEAVISIFGAIKAGGIIVCIHPKLPLNKLREIIIDANINLLVSTQFYEFIPEISLGIYHHIQKDNNKNISFPWVAFGDWISSGVTNEPHQEGDIAALIYTSGSTGKAKGIISTHNNILFSTDAINQYLRNCQNDKVLSYLPLSFDYGLYQLFLTVSRGATLFLEEPPNFLKEITKYLKEKEISGFPGLRNLFTLLTSNADEQYPLIRYVTNTGDALHNDVIAKLKKMFPNAELFLMYGLTECKRVSYLPPSLVSKKINSVGVPLQGTSVIIKNDSGNECAPYEIGELYVTGPNVCQGYWNRPNETSSTFLFEQSVNTLRTGDLFYKDDEGFLYYVSRKDNSFKSNGFRIDPAGLEVAIKEKFPILMDVIVVGIPDNVAGQLVGLYLVTNISYSLEDSVVQYCNDEFEPWQRPKFILQKNHVPLTPSGKINRNEIVKLFINQFIKKESP